jgi:hypothetical protein
VRRLLAIMSVAVLTPALASPDVAEAPIVGHTTAGPKVVTKIRTFFNLFGPVYLNCSHVDSLAVADVPPDLLPRANSVQIPSSLMPPPEGPIRTELWTASGCKRSTQVLIKLWYAQDGTQQFSASPLDKLPDGS